MSRIGYTPEQEKAKRAAIEKKVAQIEDALHTLTSLVPDHSIRADALAEQVREVGYQLDAIVQRRSLRR